MTKKNVMHHYKSGEKPKEGDLVCYSGTFWINDIGALVKEIGKLKKASYVSVEWLHKKGNRIGASIWPWNLTLVRRDAKKLISWI